MQAEKRAEEEKDSRAHYPPEGYLQEERKEGRKEGGDTFLHRGENAPRRGILISPLFPQYPRRNEEHAYLSPSPFHLKRERERERHFLETMGEAKRNETKRNATRPPISTV